MGRRFIASVLCGLALGAWAVARAGEAAAPAEALARYARPPALPSPEGEPPTPAQVRLGRALFFDTALSGARDIACASCHDPALSWGDGRGRAVGASHSSMGLRTPTLIDVAFSGRLGWDGKFRSVEAVTFAPITARDNMNLPEAEALARLRAVPDYVRQYEEAFGTPDIARGGVERALAAFERTIVSGEAPFDRWVEGRGGAVSPAAERGFALFDGRAGCSACHSGWAFTDGSFHDIGTGAGDDVGRGRLFPSSVKLRYAFKTPTLRDVARRGPYMHDGSVPDLRAVIELYDRGGVDRPSRAEGIRPLGLSARDKDDLLAFLGTLTAESPPQD